MSLIVHPRGTESFDTRWDIILLLFDFFRTVIVNTYFNVKISFLQTWTSQTCQQSRRIMRTVSWPFSICAAGVCRMNSRHQVENMRSLKTASCVAKLQSWAHPIVLIMFTFRIYLLCLLWKFNSFLCWCYCLFIISLFISWFFNSSYFFSWEQTSLSHTEGQPKWLHTERSKRFS